MNTMVSRTLSVHMEHELLLKLEAAGLDDRLAQKIIGSKNNSIATKVVHLIEDGSLETSVSQERAHLIMRRNFFGIKEVIKHFGISPTKTQFVALNRVPFSKGTLESCKDTHVLVAVFPISILDIRGKVECKLFYNHDDAWYNKQAFAKGKGEIGWQLVRKVPIADSANKTWNEQQELLSKDEETPKAQVVVYTIIGHFLASGERLFENFYVRCLDLNSDGFRVTVGNIDTSGLDVDRWWDGRRGGNIGLSAARKECPSKP